MEIFGFKFGENSENKDENPIDKNEVEISSENNIENEISFFKNVYDSTSAWTSNLGENIIDTFNSAKEKTALSYDNSKNFILETSTSINDSTKQNFVVIRDKIGETYEQIEIKNNLYVLLDYIDLSLVAAALYKIPAPPPAKIALIVVAQLLIIFAEHKKNKENSKNDDTTEFEVSKLLKNVDMKNVISILEEYHKSIPQGKQILSIVKLFSK